jgi:hypothetical protein
MVDGAHYPGTYAADIYNRLKAASGGLFRGIFAEPYQWHVEPSP